MMFGLAKIIFLLIFLGMASAAPDKRVSLALVVDNTRSMANDIKHLTHWASTTTSDKWRSANKLFSNFIVFPFNDPKVGPVTETTDAAELLRTVKKLSVVGGEDCPEMALSGILGAAKYVKPNSLMIVFTDAGPKDVHLLPEVEKIVKKKNIHLAFVLTGCCGKNCKIHEAYTKLAELSDGVVYKILKKDVESIMEMISFISNKKYVELPPTYEDVVRLLKKGKIEKKPVSLVRVVEVPVSGKKIDINVPYDVAKIVLHVVKYKKIHVKVVSSKSSEIASAKTARKTGKTAAGEKSTRKSEEKTSGEKSTGKADEKSSGKAKTDNSLDMYTICRRQLNTPAARFLHGCTAFKCEKSGPTIIEERCDANKDGTDCRHIGESWRCESEGRQRICKCIKDRRGLLIKVD